MTDRVLMELTIDAVAEVVPAAHPDCVTVHPNEPCPGYPHADEDDLP
jgi:hypothetical protein